MSEREADEKPGTIMWWALMPGAWRSHAEKLFRSAELLWEPLARCLALKPPLSQSDLDLWNHSYAFLLVAGATLEAAFKAAAMQAEINKKQSLDAIITPSKQLQKWIRTHSLVGLANRAGMIPSEEELEQLERFTKYVVWAGSYPVPLDVRDRRPDAVIYVDFRVSDSDYVWLKHFYQKALESYQHHVAELKRSAEQKALSDERSAEGPED